MRPATALSTVTYEGKSKFRYLWVTLALFLISIIGQWAAGWFEYKKEQEEHQQPVETQDYVIEMTRVSPTDLAGRGAELSVVRRLAAIQGRGRSQRGKARRDFKKA